MLSESSRSKKAPKNPVAPVKKMDSAAESARGAALASGAMSSVKTASRLKNVTLRELEAKLGIEDWPGYNTENWDY